VGQFGQRRMRQLRLCLQPLHELGGQFGEQRRLAAMGGEVVAHQRAPGRFAEQAHADREAVAQQAEQVVEQQVLVHRPGVHSSRPVRHRLWIAQVRGERVLLRAQGVGSVSHVQPRRARLQAADGLQFALQFGIGREVEIAFEQGGAWADARIGTRQQLPDRIDHRAAMGIDLQVRCLVQVPGHVQADDALAGSPAMKASAS
jgi:hypothetical protein